MTNIVRLNLLKIPSQLGYKNSFEDDVSEISILQKLL